MYQRHKQHRWIISQSRTVERFETLNSADHGCQSRTKLFVEVLPSAFVNRAILSRRKDRKGTFPLFVCPLLRVRSPFPKYCRRCLLHGVMSVSMPQITTVNPCKWDWLPQNEEHNQICYRRRGVKLLGCLPWSWPSLCGRSVSDR